MSLSDNILAVGYNHIEAEDGVIHTKDVKDFIKALKEKIPDREFAISEDADSSVHYEIDKLAGDKLI